jgi:protein-S-isoprenylcysteine O-methyltransferase Ste14
MSTETLIRMISLALILGAFTVSGYYRRGADKADRPVDYRAENRWLFRLRSAGALVFYLGLLSYLIYPPILAWAAIPAWPLALRWFGISMMALMLPMLVWMFRSLGDNITPTVKTRKEHQLVESGPYRFIRHPLYTFGFVFFLGAAFTAGNWLLFVSSAIAISALFARTPQEEELLVERFGKQYEDYMQRTGRYLPKLGK